MKTRLKSLLKGLLMSLWVLLLSGGSLLAYHMVMKPVASETLTIQYDGLTQSLTEVINQEQQQRTQAINALLTRLDAIDARLDVQQAKIQALSKTQQSQAQSIEALGLDSQALKRLESKLNRLEKRMATPSRRVVRAPVKAKRHTPKAQTPSKPLPTPPFALFDVQRRGNVSLAIVGKPNATHLSQLSALRVGQRYLGWQVTDIAVDKMVTLYQGQKIVVEMQS